MNLFSIITEMKVWFITIFILLASCSSNEKVLDPLGPAGGSMDDIPDEFPQEKEEKEFLFKDKTSAYGLDNVEAYNFNIVDLNGDFYSDIVVIPSFYSYPKFYYYDLVRQKFMQGDSPFRNPVKASFMLFYDLDNDHVLDAIVGVLNQKTELSKEPLKIFYGRKVDGKVVYDKPYSINVKISNSTIGLIDYNLDGKLDLFIGNWFKMIRDNPFPAPDYLFENKGRKFEDVSSVLVGEAKKDSTGAMFINATPTYGAQICDIDQNGYPDILTVSTNRFDNKMWMNRYKFRDQKRYFEEIGKFAGYSADSEGLNNKQGGGRSFGVACADYNNDGIMDIFVGELTHNYDSSDVDKSSVLTGRTFKYPPKYFRTEYFLDSFDPGWHEADRRGIWTDFNNDGLLDLLVDNSGYPPYSKLVLFEQLFDHAFENRAAQMGVDIMNPISTVVLDINRDGKMDILTAQSQIRDESLKPKIKLFENNIPTKGRGVRLFLRGEKANFHGLNATITMRVKKDGRILNRLQNVAYSYGALPPQNEEGVHFGIAEGERVDSVIVRWPYSKVPNTSRTALEKVYKLPDEFSGVLSMTLCENGNILVGRRNCL